MKQRIMISHARRIVDMTRSTLFVIVLLCCFLRWPFLRRSEYLCTAKELHLSHVSGSDSPACGTSQTPCQSFPVSMEMAELGDTILIDGTDTATNPYTCGTNTSGHPGYFINKSLSLIGQNETAHVTCIEGLFLTGKGQLNSTLFHLFGISFLNTRLNFENCSAEITDCSFTNFLKKGSSRKGRLFDTTFKSAGRSEMVDSAVFVNNSHNFSVSNSAFKNNQIQAIKVNSTSPGGKLSLTYNLFLKNNAGIAVQGVKQGVVEISHTVFSKNGDGVSISLQLTSSSRVIIDNITIENTRISPGSQGAALYISCGLPAGNVVVIKRSTFQNNWNTSPGAGAVCLDNAPEVPLSPGCLNQETPPYVVYNYTNSILFKRCLFEQNHGMQAGALSISNAMTSFQDCTFKDNFVGFRARHVFVAGGSGGVEFVNSTMLHSKESTRYQSLPPPPAISPSTDTSFVYSGGSGPLLFKNTSLTYLHLKEKNLVTVVDGGRVEIDNSSRMTCPIGGVMTLNDQSHEVLARTQLSNLSSCRLKRKVFTVSCALCPTDFYSLEKGEMRGFKVNNIGDPCIVCPYGGHCSNGRNIAALPNFWGLKTSHQPPTLEFYNCPPHYCKPSHDSLVSLYNGCLGNRSGILCGACVDGFTETLFSTNCRISKNCSDNMFWLIAIAFVVLLSWFFITRPPVIHVLLSEFLERKWECCRGNSSHGDDEFSDPGYLKVIVYFYQVASLLLVQTTVQQVLTSRFVYPVIGIFNFQIHTSVSGLDCPLPGLNVVTKELFLTSGVFAVAFTVLVTYGVHRTYMRLRHKEHASFHPYIGALLNVIIYGYALLASVSFKLLLCKPIAGEWRLFYDGNVRCFQWWQYLIVLFVVIYVLPFVGALYWGSHKLNRGEVSPRELLIACVLPIACLIKWSTCEARTPCGWEAFHSQEHEAAKKVFHSPFQLPADAGTEGAIYWDSVLIGRRLLLIVQSTFIPYTSLKFLVMTVTCFLFLMHHFFTKPYKDPKVNLLETVSMATHVLLGVFNLIQATYISATVDPSGPDEILIGVLNWIEAVILLTGPALMIVVIHLSVLVALVNGAFRLVKHCITVVVSRSPPAKTSPPRDVYENEALSDDNSEASELGERNKS